MLKILFLSIGEKNLIYKAKNLLLTYKPRIITFIDVIITKNTPTYKTITAKHKHQNQQLDNINSTIKIIIQLLLCFYPFP